MLRLLYWRFYLHLECHAIIHVCVTYSTPNLTQVDFRKLVMRDLQGRSLHDLHVHNKTRALELVLTKMY